MMFWYGSHFVAWQMMLVWVGTFVLGALTLAVAGVLVVEIVGRRRDKPDDDPVRIVDRRLARGEIDVEEYRRLRDLFGGHPGGSLDSKHHR